MHNYWGLDATSNMIWAGPQHFLLIARASSEHSDQPAHPCSVIRVFAIHLKTLWILGYSQSACEDWSDCAKSDLSLRWAQMQSCRKCFQLIWHMVYNIFISPTQQAYNHFAQFDCLESNLETGLSMEIYLLINMKMPTIVGIFIFISRENFMLSWVEHEKSFITSEPGFI